MPAARNRSQGDPRNRGHGVNRSRGHGANGVTQRRGGTEKKEEEHATGRMPISGNSGLRASVVKPFPRSPRLPFPLSPPLPFRPSPLPFPPYTQLGLTRKSCRTRNPSRAARG